MTCLLRVRRVVPPTLLAALGVLLVLALHAFDARVSAQQDYGGGALPQDQDPAPVDYSGEIPAHVSAVDGSATLEREGRIDPVEENIILLAGDRLRTTRGRIEILYADGSALAVDEHTSLDLLDDSLMRLLGGRVKLVIARATGSVEYRVDTAGGSALVRTPGEYRIALLERQSQPEVDLTVLRGSAELVNDHGRTLVRAGTYAVANPLQAPSLPYVANSAAWTAFERWADDQRAARTGAYSTRYLPTEVQYYAGAFDRYGDWSYEPTYGYVWYPRVDAGWRPYHHGKWSFHARFGWFWVGASRWAWPTHHYGRWGFHRSRWYWIPGRQWGPAWVHWARSPRFIGWCPLGFDNRPVFSITTINVNINQRWHGWNVLPRQHFVPNVAVPRHVVAASTLPVSTWSDFRTASPPRPNLREDPAPIRSVGATRGSAVPRNGAAPRLGFDGQGARGSSPAIDAGARSGSRAMPRDGAAARTGAPSVQAPASQVPSGSRAPAGSRLGAPSTSSSRSRAVPSDRTTAPIESRSPVRLRNAPAPDAGSPASRSNPSIGNASPSRLTPRARPSDQPPASPPSGSAIRRGQPAPGASSRQTPPPNAGVPDNGRVVPMPSGSRRAPDAVRVPPPGGGAGGSRPSRSASPRVAPGGNSGGSGSGSAPSRSSSPRVAPGGGSGGSAPSRSAPSRVAPRGGQSSAPARSSSPSRVSGGQGSRQAPAASGGNRGQATRRGGGI